MLKEDTHGPLVEYMDGIVISSNKCKSKQARLVVNLKHWTVNQI